jgi:hypothetical protein
MKASLNIEKDGKTVVVPLYDIDPKFFKGKMLTVSIKNPAHIEYLKKEFSGAWKKEKEYDTKLKSGSLKESILNYSGELTEECGKKMMSKDTDEPKYSWKHKCKYCGKVFKEKEHEEFKKHVKKCAADKMNY